MKIINVFGCPYEDNEGEVANLTVELDEGEKLSKGGFIKIEMMDDTFIEREIRIINPKFAGDFAEVSEKARKAGWKCSKNPVTEITGACVCDVVVMNVPRHEVKTDYEIERRVMMAEVERRYCLTPYKEIHSGSESIYDNVQKGYSVPDKVLEYLRVDNCYLAGAGVYNHPFEPEVKMLGPAMFSDGYYYWDSNTAEYVSKYGLVLPEEFISHVMSEKGTEFIEQYKNNSGK